MFNDRVHYALANFIEQGYFEKMQDNYVLEEHAVNGRSILKVDIADDNLCLRDFDNKRKCAFINLNRRFGLGKSSDHIIFQNKVNGWIINIIEMKTTVGRETWQEIKLKTRSSYLQCMALAGFLGIDIIDVKVYTTYENEKFNDIKNTQNIALHKPSLGHCLFDYKKEEWTRGLIKIRMGDKDENIVTLSHKEILMQRDNKNILQGKLYID